jgi:integrase/recombinase XerD
MSGRQARLQMPFVQWPSADQLLWQQAVSNDDPFSDGYRAARLAKASLARYLVAWRRFLGFLNIEEPTALDIVPAKRLSSERVRAFIAHLRISNNPRSTADLIDALYQVTLLMMPSQDWTWLRILKSRLLAATPRPRAKGPVITSLQLLDAGERMMEDCKLKPNLPIILDAAIRYREGFMLAFLAFVPLRPKNLRALDIGRQLIRERERWFVTIPPDETKTETAIDFELPALLEEYLGVYLELARPRILRDKACAALWMSPKGGRLSSPGLLTSFSRISRRLGFHITPHDARDAAATTWAISAPDRIRIASDLLAHRDPHTTTKSYNRARGIEASRAYRSIISRVRKQGPKRAA